MDGTAMKRDNLNAWHLLTLCLSVILIASPAGAVWIMPLGDSNTKGFHGSPASSYRYELFQMDPTINFVGDYWESGTQTGWDAQHQAISGSDIERMLRLFPSSLARHSPDIVLVLAGTNNHNDAPTTDFDAKYQALLDMIRDGAPEAHVVFSTVPKFDYDRVPATPFWTTDFVDTRNNLTFPAMNQAIARVADTDPLVSYVDLYGVIDPAVDVNTDGVHLLKSGHEKLAALFYDEVARIKPLLPERPDIEDPPVEIPYILGDLSKDGRVDDQDIGMLFAYYTGSNQGTLLNPEADLSGDGDVDEEDIALAFSNFTLPDSAIIDDGPPAIPGDLSGDGRVDDQDIGMLFAYYTGSNQGILLNPEADLSGDGDVDEEDLALAFSHFTLPDPTIPGDLSGDGNVDDEDMGMLFAYFTGPDQGPPLNPDADLSGDGDVDEEDLALAFANFTGPASANVPEPSSPLLLGLGGLLAVRRSRV